MAVQEYLSGVNEILGGSVAGDGDRGSLGVGDLFGTRLGLALEVVVFLFVLVGFRSLLSVVVASAINTITYISLFGGLLGGLFMAWVIGVGIDAGDGELFHLRQLQFGHVVYGTVGGALFPWMYCRMGACSVGITLLPDVLHSAYMWSMIMFAVAGVTYLLVGTIGGVSSYLRQWGGIIGLYIVYGIWLGLWTGVAWMVLWPVVGVEPHLL